eukprot:gene10458-3211_t
MDPPETEACQRALRDMHCRPSTPKNLPLVGQSPGVDGQPMYISLGCSIGKFTNFRELIYESHLSKNCPVWFGEYIWLPRTETNT